MKKTTVKKLSLSRETLRELQKTALAHAAGGTGTTLGVYCNSSACFAPTNADHAC
ncbi:MAG TPA: class I lanthipeptide [Thermoanaerobaculia bacterium]